MPDARSPLFIVNPIAGSGRAQRMTGRIEAWLKESRIDGRVLETRERGHAERLAGAATDLGHDRVIAVGGDGTIQEVLKDRKSTRLNSSHIQKSRMPSSA